MIEEVVEVGLAVERRALQGQWGGHAWRPISIFASAPEVAAWTSLGVGANFARYYAGAYPIQLFSTDTANYRDNLASGVPKLWVVLRDAGAETSIEIALITADPAEGEASTEAGNNTVETIDMPPEIAGVVAAFIAAHHTERAVFKRQRDGKPMREHWRDGRRGGNGSGDAT